MDVVMMEAMPLFVSTSVTPPSMLLQLGESATTVSSTSIPPSAVRLLSTVAEEGDHDQNDDDDEQHQLLMTRRVRQRRRSTDNGHGGDTGMDSLQQHQRVLLTTPDASAESMVVALSEAYQTATAAQAAAALSTVTPLTPHKRPRRGSSSRSTHDSDDTASVSGASPSPSRSGSARKAARSRPRSTPGSASSRNTAPLTNESESTAEAYDEPGAGAASPSASGVVKDRMSKGLRQFSSQVCETVRLQYRTTYAKVADELVDVMSTIPTPLAFDPSPRGMQEREWKQIDEKNIRRRVYDALNVLHAVNVISKEQNKEIQWRGLPHQLDTELNELEDEKKACLARVLRKRKHLSELLIRQVCLKNLIELNKKRAVPTENGTTSNNHSSNSDPAAATSVALEPSPVSPMPGGAETQVWSTVPSPVKPVQPQQRLKQRAPNSSLPPIARHQPAHMSSRYASLLLPRSNNPTQHRVTAPQLHGGIPLHPTIAQATQSPIRPTQVPHANLYESSSSASAASAAATSSSAASSSSSPHISIIPTPSLPIPFLLITTAPREILHLHLSNTREDVKMTFSAPFSIHEHWQAMREMKLDRVASYDLQRFVGTRELIAFYPKEAFTDGPTMGVVRKQ